MPTEIPIYEALFSQSFLEYAFLRWVLAPATKFEILKSVEPQQEIPSASHRYKVDYAIKGEQNLIAIELDGFEFHGSRAAFSYDRLRQNDLHAAGWIVIRFSYDSIRLDTERCVLQLQAVMALDPLLSTLLIESPVVERPDMSPDPLYGFTLPPGGASQVTDSYFELIRGKINLKTLRVCQNQAFGALGTDFRSGGTNASFGMTVGAGKTALGGASWLAYT
jgi:very-short-patch-repair endonuclease